MAKLNDLQTILLSTAAQRSEGSLLPATTTLNADTDRLNRAIGALIKAGYADEQRVTSTSHAWRIEGDEHYGAVINDAGRVAIGIERTFEDESPACEPTAQTPATKPPRPTKVQVVLSLLQREQGATLAELVEATGWLPHTTRAALTGIRKRGHDLARSKRDDVTCYTVAV